MGMSENKYKKIVKEKVRLKAFDYFIKKKSQRKKYKKLIFETFKMAPYLNDNDCKLSVEERQFLFKCRIEDIDVRANRKWKYNEINCLMCNSEEIETQIHILECSELIKINRSLSYIPAYDNIFCHNIVSQIYTSNVIKENM